MLPVVTEMMETLYKYKEAFSLRDEIGTCPNIEDFRHLNVRIAKNNLAYPLLRDICSVLGSSKCEVLSVSYLKDAFHSFRLAENSKKYCDIPPYFGSTSYHYQRMPM